MAVLLSSNGLTAGKMSEASYFYREDRPVLIAHRGSSGLYPEHSIGGHIHAYHAGADFIEIDLQITKDGVLVV